MTAIKYCDADFARVRPNQGSRKIAFYLYYGDAVRILNEDNGWLEIEVPHRATEDLEILRGFVKTPLPLRNTPILKMSMVDVQQGDGLVIQTPSGKIILVDGGDNKLFARHVAARFRALRSTSANPLSIDAIIVTHGDADHFNGLTEILKSESLTGSRAHKRIFIHPKRVFHNGLVKGPSSLPDRDKLGQTLESIDGHKFITDLYEDTREAGESATNRPFDIWHRTLRKWAERGPIHMERVDVNKSNVQPFAFLNEDEIKIELHSPISEKFRTEDGDSHLGLKFFKSPPPNATLHEGGHSQGGSYSASHTINGHSISFRMTFGNVRFLFTGDLNQEAMEMMLSRLNPRDFEAEILKTPHHGSSDFDLNFLKTVRPVVSLISSGDESARKEYIHPRATLMNSLGATSRHDTGLIFCTELAAFFKYLGPSYRRNILKELFTNHEKETFTKDELVELFTGSASGPISGEPFFHDGFERTQFGLIEVRTDGERVLIFTHSGKNNIFEAYRFKVTRSGKWSAYGSV